MEGQVVSNKVGKESEMHTYHEERLEIMDLTSIEERVRRGHFIETHKILNNHLNIRSSQSFEITQDTKTR